MLEEELYLGVVAEELGNKALHHPAAVALAWVLPANDKYTLLHLFFFDIIELPLLFGNRHDRYLQPTE